MQVRQQLLLRKGVVPLPVSFPHLDCAFPLVPGQSAQWDAEPEGTWFSPSTIIKLLVYLSCIIKCQVSCCSCTAVYLKTKIKVGVREEALINLTLLWAKSSLRDCIFPLPGQMHGVYAQLVCVCVGFLLWLPATEMSSICTISFTGVSRARGMWHMWQEATEYWILTTAGKERESAGKAIDCGGTGIVTIVSIHIISSQLLFLAFRRKRKTACSGSPASPLS